MKDEIKEILDKLQKVANCETASRNALMEMKDKDYQLLLYYITNLQEENDILKRDIEAMKHNYNLLVRIIENGESMTQKFENGLTYQDYKSRNEKALEKLKTLIPICIMPNNTLVHGTEKAKIIKETLNILKGE